MPPSVAVLSSAVDARHVLVVDAPRPSAESLVAWLWVGSADGDLLIEQVSVDPTVRGQRLGTQLLSMALDHARNQGFPGVCLTTFDDVPWNGPLYRSLGFHRIDDALLGADLRAILASEHAAGLAVSPRSAYRRRSRVI